MATKKELEEQLKETRINLGLCRIVNSELQKNKDDQVAFAKFMFWVGVDWEGGVNASLKCNVDAEIEKAMELWELENRY